MKHIAFYAPLKAPSHPVPSGDRAIARLFMLALKEAGYLVSLASTLRLYSGRGERTAQQALEAAAKQEAARLLPETYDAWFTYHHYAKAPDFLGAEVAGALKIPYFLAEASISDKYARGVYQDWHRETCRIVGLADAVFTLNPKDTGALIPYLKTRSAEVKLPVFLEDSLSVIRPDAPPHKPLRLITAAMMREGAKCASYQQLAASLKLLGLPWTLTIIGDGAAAEAVYRAFSIFPAEQLDWRGKLEHEAVLAAYAAADICVWPAVDEALGMALLEAQAAGLPVIAGQSQGVASVVADGQTGLLTPQGDTAAFAAAIAALADDTALYSRLSLAARERIAEHHSVTNAALTLKQVIDATF